MRASFLNCPIDILTMDETVELARQAMRTRRRLQHVALNVAKFINMRSDAILAADRQAAHGKTEYDDEYFARFFEKVQPILEKRISSAITGVASVINAAWIQAGKPAVSVDAPPRPPRPIRQGG